MIIHGETFAVASLKDAITFSIYKHPVGGTYTESNNTPAQKQGLATLDYAVAASYNDECLWLVYYSS